MPPRPVQPAALPRGDGHPQRDKLRAAALEASTAYALTPCDEAAKAIMVRAVSAYAKAWADMMGCGPDGCDYRKINVTAATFSTPLDISAREAIGVAFEKRGVSLDDFPSSLRINVAMLVRGRAFPATACPQTGAQVMPLGKIPLVPAPTRRLETQLRLLKMRPVGAEPVQYPFLAGKTAPILR